MKDWSSTIYGFFAPTPSITYVSGQWCHVFKCLGKSCKHSVHQFLDNGDKGLTSNMHKYVKACWGEDIFNAIGKAGSLDDACDTIQQYQSNSSIKTVLALKGKMTYSDWTHTKAKT